MSESIAPAVSNPVEYIQHHLTNLCLGCNPVTHHPRGLVDFHAFFLDVWLTSTFLAVLIGWVGWKIGRGLDSENPSGVQNLLEAIIEFVDQQTRDVFPDAPKVVAPMALTIFLWVFIMNCMDLIPVDLFPKIFWELGVKHYKIVPPTNLDMTFGLSLTVFAFIIHYNIKAKGGLGYIKMFLTHPFGPWLAPVNVVMTMIEEIAKPLSLALRLFGNIFAGELIFMLIALMPWWIQWLPGAGWAIFHVIIVTVQAFIFMLLTVAYLALAAQPLEHH